MIFFNEWKVTYTPPYHRGFCGDCMLKVDFAVHFADEPRE
jgi:hypothetical protein